MYTAWLPVIINTMYYFTNFDYAIILFISGAPAVMTPPGVMANHYSRGSYALGPSNWVPSHPSAGYIMQPAMQQVTYCYFEILF